MLRRFLYLDSAALSDYVSAIEGGRRESREQRSATNTAGGGDLDLKVARGGGSRSKETEEATTFTDTPHAMFERLMDAAEEDPDWIDWLEVLDADADMPGAAIGTMLQADCDLYIPDIFKALGSKGGLADALETLESLRPFAEAMDLDMEDVPSVEQSQAMRGLLRGFDAGQAIVGEFDGSDWRLAGQLESDAIHGDVEGRAKIVGKVSSIWRAGKWKPLLALPGSSLVPREQRRALEKKSPDPDEEDQYLQGPAMMLDVLAIYR